MYSLENSTYSQRIFSSLNYFAAGVSYILVHMLLENERRECEKTLYADMVQV